LLKNVKLPWVAKWLMNGFYFDLRAKNHKSEAGVQLLPAGKAASYVCPCGKPTSFYGFATQTEI